MTHLKFPYRSPSHLPFLEVIDKSGAWEERGLDVEFDFYISEDDAHEELAKGNIQFVDGNHVTPYGARVRGDKWVYLGQTALSYDHHLITRDEGITKLEDLAGKTILTRGMHPSLNTWLFLKQNGLDVDAGDVIFENCESHESQVDLVAENDEYDAAFITPPRDLLAKRKGLNVIEVDPLPMIFFTTVSTSMDFALENPQVTEDFVRGVMDGIDFFINNKEETIEIIEENVDKDWDDELLDHLYEKTAEMLVPDLYPSIEAIENVYQLALRLDEDAKKVNPMELWDLHFLRKIQDTATD